MPVYSFCQHRSQSAVSEKLYQQANPQGAAGAGPQAGQDAGAAGGQYYDADYKVVDDDDNKKQ